MTDLKALNRCRLPENKVKYVVMSGKYKCIVDALGEFEVEVLPTVPVTDLDDRVNDHADMLFNYFGNKRGVIHKSQYRITEFINSLGLCITYGDELSREYPFDCRYNFLIADNNLIVGKKIKSKTLSKLSYDYNVLKVNQGYVACNIVSVAENAFITSDKSIYKLLSSIGSDCCLVSSNGISLPGYSCGFLGGCCGKISKDLMAFTGKLSLHPDFDVIKSFLRKYDVDILELSAMPLTDIGGIIPVIESGTL
ncbi:MAG: hypothetical protein GX222_07570 [Ruminococcaceae bacterium]|nr:hypothetical protein [Oscillospiraceae bacterium]